MEWTVYKDVESFAAQVKGLLYEEEDINHLFLGVLALIEKGEYEESFMAIAEEGGKMVAVCLMTPPEPLQLKVFQEVPGLEEQLVRLLLAEGVEPVGVIAERELAERFSQMWSQQTGSESRVVMDTGLYRINGVVSGLVKSPGTWRIANKGDKQLLAGWYLAFEQEARFQHPSETAAAKRIEKFVEDKEVYVWEHEGKVVSCLKKSRPTRNGLALSFIYAPPEYREEGFIRTLIAEVTEELLMEFDFLVLYGDFLDEDAKRLYHEIGYEKIGDPVFTVFGS